MCQVSADQILAAFLPMSGLRRRNLSFCALLNLTKVLLQDDEVDHKKQKTENGSNGAAAEEEGEEEEDAEEEEDIDGEEEEDVDGEGEEDLDEEEGGEGEKTFSPSSAFCTETLHFHNLLCMLQTHSVTYSTLIFI